MLLLNKIGGFLILVCVIQFQRSVAQNENKYISMLLAKVLGFRLSNDTSPQSYALQIEPHFTNREFTFDGTASIIFQVHKPTRDVTFHVADLLEIDKTYTRLVLSDGTIKKPIAQRWSDVLEFFNIKFQDELPVGLYTLKLKWLGHEAKSLRGFYRGIDHDSNDDEK